MWPQRKEKKHGSVLDEKISNVKGASKYGKPPIKRYSLTQNMISAIAAAFFSMGVIIGTLFFY